MVSIQRTARLFPTGFEWRPAIIDDLPALVDLYAAVDADCRTHWGGPAEEIRHDFEEPGLDPERDTVLAVAPSGAIAALGWLMPARKAIEKEWALLWGVTHPAFYRRGLGAVILAWLETRAREKAAERQGDLPFVGRTITPDDLPGRIALYERRGYRPARAYFRMRRTLSQDIPGISPPGGVRLEVWDEKHDAAAYRVSNESFRDHWGSAPQTPDQWRLFTRDSVSFRPGLSLLALAGDEVVGIAINRVIEDEIARTDIKEGWIGTVGVPREWRNRGLASALLCESMRRFQAAGFEYAGLSVDTENLTGALRLYQSLGFASIQRTLLYGKAIS